FVSAKGSVRIKDDRKVPLTLEGVPMGAASATVDASAKMSPDGQAVLVDVSIPMLHADLPTSTQHAVQTLDADPHVKIGRHSVAGKLVLVPLGPPEKPKSPGSLKLRGA